MMKFILLLLLLISLAQGYKFLFYFPIVFKSHMQILQPLAKGLSEKGHHVTFVTGFKEKYPGIGNNTKLIELSYPPTKLRGTVGAFTNRMPILSQLVALGVVHHLHWNSFHDPSVKELMRSNETYDVFVGMNCFYNDIAALVQHKFKAPSIEIAFHGNGYWLYHVTGNPLNPNFVPEVKTSFSSRMNAFEKLVNILIGGITILSAYVNNWLYELIIMWQTDYPGIEDRPSLLTLMANKSLVLVASDPCVLNYPQPLPPHFKSITGISLQRPGVIPKDLKEFVDSADEGFIYFSWGTAVQKSIIENPETLTIFKNVFNKINKKVIWKAKPDLISGTNSNIIIKNWLPQTSLLAHKNCRLFLTHGGYASVTEAIYHSVPMVGTPLWYDQFKNVRFIEETAMGVGVDLHNITEESVTWAINEVFNNKMYYDNVQKFSQIFRDRPETPLEEAIRWMEFVAKYGNVLQPHSASMAWYEKLYLDVILLTSVAILALWTLISALFKRKVKTD